MTPVQMIHKRLVYPRRACVLSKQIAPLVPANARLLDIGCGDGLIASLIKKRCENLDVVGMDLFMRPETHIPVSLFDGSKFPFSDKSFDVVSFIDVLHHTLDPEVLLREARRVSSRYIIVKDHLWEGVFAGPTLRLMDWAGNAHLGVSLPFNYWKERQWHDTFTQMGLKIEYWSEQLQLYPWPLSALFDRRLHFIACLRVSEVEQSNC